MTLAGDESVNEAQKNFWSVGPGKKWVVRHDALTKVLQNVSESLVQRVSPAVGERIMDIGCGAGETSMAFARCVGPTGKVVGADISETLLTHARSLAADTEIKGLEFACVDVQTHEFDQGAFDHLASRFGVMFFSDPVAALENMRKALKPGGKVCFACWAPAASNPWFRIPAEAAIARLGKPAPTPPHAPGPLGFADSTYVLDLFRTAGFSNCNADLAEIDLTPPGNIGDVTQLACELGPAVRIVDELNGDDDDRRAIAQAVAGNLEQFQTDAGIKIPANIWYYTATNG